MSHIATDAFVMYQFLEHICRAYNDPKVSLPSVMHLGSELDNAWLPLPRGLRSTISPYDFFKVIVDKVGEYGRARRKGGKYRGFFIRLPYSKCAELKRFAHELHPNLPKPYSTN